MPEQLGHEVSRLDLSLTLSEFNWAANAKKYIGTQVLAPASVSEQSADFPLFPKDQFSQRVMNVDRNPDGSYKTDTAQWKMTSYRTKGKGLESPVDTVRAKRNRDIISEDMIASRLAVSRVVTAFEAEVASAVFNTTTWSGADLTTAVATKWTTSATAKPRNDIDGAYEKVETNCGMTPNTIILSNKAYRAMIRTAQMEGYVDNNDGVTSLGIAYLKSLFDVENIIVAKAQYNAASRDVEAGASMLQLWDTSMCMVCYIEPGNEIQEPNPQLGRSLFWSEENIALPGADGDPIGVIVEEYYDPRIRGNNFRARADWLVRVFNPECGHLLTNVT